VLNFFTHTYINKLRILLNDNQLNLLAQKMDYAYSGFGEWRFGWSFRQALNHHQGNNLMMVI